jgi:hypothetical protein
MNVKNEKDFNFSYSDSRPDNNFEMEKSLGKNAI